MGILDRLHDLVTATGGALEAPIGFIKDTAESLPEIGSLNLPMFAHDVYHAFIDRSGQLLQNTVGPQGIGGELIGALPDPVRAAGGAVFDPLQEGMDLAYHDLVGKPLSTAITAGAIADSGGLDELFKPKTWAESWNIAEHRSPGQSLALSFLTHDILDPAQIRKAQGTDWYGVISGVTDAVARVGLDPTAIAAGKITEAAKAARAFTGAEDVERLSMNGQVAKYAEHNAALVAEHGTEQAAAIIRHEQYPRHPMGAQISTVIADAPNLPAGLIDGLDGQAAIERVTRALGGSGPDIQMLYETRADLAGQIERLAERKGELKSTSANGLALANNPDDLANIDRELNALYDQQKRVDRLADLVAYHETTGRGAGELASLPRTSGPQALRGRFSRSDVYQAGPFSKVLHFTFDMDAHPWLHLDRPDGDIQVWRQLQRTPLPVEEQQAWRARYMAQTDPVGRLSVAMGAEKAGLAAIATEAGMTPDELQIVLKEAAKGRSIAKQALDSRKWDGATRTSTMMLEDENGVMRHITFPDEPLYPSQLPNLHPLADMDRVKKTIGQIARFKARHPNVSLASEGADKLLLWFAQAWKPSVLIRPGFMFRFLTDEGLRSVSKIGAWSTMKNIGHGLSSGGSDGVGAVLEKIGFQPRELDDLGPKLAGHQFEAAFGAKGDGAQIYHKTIQAREAFGSLVSQDEGKLMEQMVQSGAWRSVEPTEMAYAKSWEHAVNNQIGKDPLGARLLEEMQAPTKRQLRAGVVAKTPEQIIANTIDWLKTDPAGQAVAKRMDIWHEDKYEQWIAHAHDQINAYLPTDELKAAAWQGSARHDELVKLIPDVSQRPVVHGGVLAEAFGGPISKIRRKIVDTALSNLVGKPSNILMRDPFFDHMYQAEISRRVRLLTGSDKLEPSVVDRIAAFARGESTHVDGDLLGGVSVEDFNKIQRGARRYAESQTKNLFHNFAEEFHFAKALGMLAPFSNAWGQIGTRWAGIAIDNPAFVRRLQIIWRSPERAGLVTDGKGNVLDEDGRIVTPVGSRLKNANGKWVNGPSQYKKGDPAADGERNVTLSVPDWASDIPGLKGLVSAGKLRLGKDSLNFIAHGLPPVGPLVQIGVNEIAKARPDLEKSLAWALPYGVTPQSIDIIKPTLLRRLQTTSEGDANRSFAYTTMAIWSADMVDFNLGKRAKPPKWSEVEQKAQDFWSMRTWASFMSPASPQFTSPYQPYIDAYRARRDLDAKLTDAQRALPSYQTPDEWFLANYGAEFFPLVASMSKSIDGIPPTLEGQQLHESLAPLVAQYPELGGLFTGEEGAGEFSRAVYEAQFSQKVGPGVSDAERRPQTHAEFETQTSTKLGWMRFGRMMDTLDSLLHQRGLTSYNVKKASDLRALKQAYVYYLAQDPHYKGWYEDYASFDPTKWDHRIAGMTAATKNPILMARPEFQGLAQYLSARKEITGILRAAESQSLTAQSNQPLLLAWDAYVNHLVDTNLAFGALYHRWLENDQVGITPITLLAESGQLQPVGA